MTISRIVPLKWTSRGTYVGFIGTWYVVYASDSPRVEMARVSCAAGNSPTPFCRGGGVRVRPGSGEARISSRNLTFSACAVETLKGEYFDSARRIFKNWRSSYIEPVRNREWRVRVRASCACACSEILQKMFGYMKKMFYLCLVVYCLTERFCLFAKLSQHFLYYGYYSSPPYFLEACLRSFERSSYRSSPFGFYGMCFLFLRGF